MKGSTTTPYSEAFLEDLHQVAASLEAMGIHDSSGVVHEALKQLRLVQSQGRTDDKLDDLLQIVESPEDRAQPDWICCGCGSVNQCRTLRYENPTSGVDYDLQCTVCDGTEFEEGYHSALMRVIDQRDRLEEKAALTQSAGGSTPVVPSKGDTPRCDAAALYHICGGIDGDGPEFPYVPLEKAREIERCAVSATEASVDDLAMLIRQLVHKVRNLSPDSSLADRAMDYLRRHGLEGSVLRSADSRGVSE